MNVGSLFSGIGGLDLGLERAGFTVRWQCEIDPYCRAVLGHHWRGVKCYEDIRDIDGDAERVDLIAGGFPCQPVSLAGKGLAQEDPRWLWPEFARVVGDLRPRYVLVENVPGLVKRGLDLVVTGLAEMGYDAEWEIVSAAACGAPHLRERIFVVAHTNGDGNGRQGQSQSDGQAQPGCEASEQRHDADGLRDVVAHSSSERRQQITGSSHGDEGADGRWPQEDHLASGDGQGDRAGEVHRVVADSNCASRNSPWPTGEAVFRPEAVERLGRRSCGDGSYWAVEPDVGRVAHGVPNRLAQLRALGNAVVPQVAEAVGRMILESA